MKTLQLENIRFGWTSHKAALWWLWLLYRKPNNFTENLKPISLPAKLLTATTLFIHIIPYIFAISFFVNYFTAFLNKPDTILNVLTNFDFFYLTASKTVKVIAFGIVVGIACGIAIGISSGIAVGIAFGIAFGTTSEIAFGVVFGIAVGIAFGVAFGIAVRIAFGIAVGIAFGIAFGVAVEIAFGIALGITLTISISRCYYYPLHFILMAPAIRKRFFRYHPIMWDDLCSTPFWKLDKLLVDNAAQYPEHGNSEIERLIKDYPAQRLAALKAKVTLIARNAANIKELSNLPAVASQLPEGEKGFLNETKIIREGINEIAGIQLRINIVNRPYFKDILTQSLCKEVEVFKSRIGGLHEPLQSEFYKASENWLKIANKQHEAVKKITSKEATPQVFRAGDPVNREAEAFIIRSNIIGELERQIMLSSGCPGIVLYGRRRTGKSTLVKNLKGFLPVTVIPVNLSFQNPHLFTSINYFVNYVKDEVNKNIPDIELKANDNAGLPELFDILTECDKFLKQENKRALLIVDEYEKIDQKIGENVFTEDLLATIRESIQYHRNLTWIFAGNHDIDELVNAEWTSYLISARTIEVPLFSIDETRLLLTEPLRHSTFWAKDAVDRPCFSENLWGHNGIERAQAESAGWPFFVQLIAETIVDMLNDSELVIVNDELFEKALDKSIVKSDTTFKELLYNECKYPGELEYIKEFRNADFQPPPKDEDINKSLRRRLLVEEENGQWRLKAPIMLRWLKKRG